MKKTYMTPEIYVESFSLTQSIAYGCTAQNMGLGKPASADAQSCGWDIGGSVYFAYSNAKICTAGEAEIVCYNAPVGNVIFGS